MNLREKAVEYPCILCCRIKKSANNDIFAPASQLVNRAVIGMDSRKPCPSMPKLTSLNRMANRVRESARPAEPKDLDFEISTEYINSLQTNFLREDFRVDTHRHLMFASDAQLELLGRAKSWYIDGTFKVVNEPFTQLLSIHAFAKSEDGNIKQFPLAFFLLSRKKKRDYKEALRKLVLSLPTYRVEEVIIDFEMAMWKAIPQVLPDVAIRGCGFHWGQAVWRHIQGLGLQASYRERTDTYDFCQKILALPYLPAEHIPPTFDKLRKAVTTPALTALCDYVSDTWINGTETWKPRSWSVFNQAVRTNNDVEGWHRKMNHAACKAKVPFYLLLKLLADESRLVFHQLRLLTQEKLKRRQRKKYIDHQRRLFQAWDDFISGTISVKKLHRKCSKIAAPKQ